MSNRVASALPSGALFSRKVTAARSRGSSESYRTWRPAVAKAGRESGVPARLSSRVRVVNYRGTLRFSCRSRTGCCRSRRRRSRRRLESRRRCPGWIRGPGGSQISGRSKSADRRPGCRRRSRPCQAHLPNRGRGRPTGAQRRRPPATRSGHLRCGASCRPRRSQGTGGARRRHGADPGNLAPAAQ